MISNDKVLNSKGVQVPFGFNFVRIDTHVTYLSVNDDEMDIVRNLFKMYSLNVHINRIHLYLSQNLPDYSFKSKASIEFLENTFKNPIYYDFLSEDVYKRLTNKNFNRHVIDDFELILKPLQESV